MRNRKSLVITFLIFFLVGLAIIVGIIAFLAGRQAGPVSSEEQETMPIDVVAAPTTPSAAQPPAIVTNTPTVTPIPTPTVGPTTTPTSTDTPTPTPTNTPSPTPTPIVVITHVNALGRLETAEFAMRTVIDLEKDPSNLWEQIVGTDKLILVAEGEVAAGFDLNKVKPTDIEVDGPSVKIILPPAEILYSRIDNEGTYVYERRTGLLVKPDQTLESRARQLAEEALLDWAAERGIHDKAEEYGRVQVENLLRSLGFTEITIEIKESEQL